LKKLNPTISPNGRYVNVKRRRIGITMKHPMIIFCCPPVLLRKSDSLLFNSLLGFEPFIAGPLKKNCLENALSVTKLPLICGERILLKQIF
jgi:hypothetical protein